MGIPSLETIKRDLGVEGKGATVIRQAMEWAEGDDPKPTLERYYENEVYSAGQGLYHDLSYYDRNYSDRVRAALTIIDRVLDTHGVEYIQSNQDTFHDAEGLSYANTGDTYGTTVVYDHSEGRWHIGDWGSFVEYDETRFGEEGDGDHW